MRGRQRLVYDANRRVDLRFQTSEAGTQKVRSGINDDYFAVTESADESIGKEARIAIYNAQTLEPDRYIEDQNGATISMLRAGESVYWPGNIMNRLDLSLESNQQDGIPVVDRSGKRLFYFQWEGRNSRLVSADGASIA